VGDVAADEITVDHRGSIRGRVDLPGRLAPAVAIRAATVLVLEDETVIQGSGNIINWARANPAGSETATGPAVAGQ